MRTTSSFYANRLTTRQRRLLARVPRADSLIDEIGLARVQIGDLVERSQDAGPLGSVASSQLIRMIEALTRMVQVHARIGPAEPDELALLAEETRRRLVEFGFDDPVRPSSPSTATTQPPGF